LSEHLVDPVPATPERTPASWLDRCRMARDRLLASPRFQRWAVAFPPTRPIARRQANALFDLTAGFVYSQVLYACVRLGILQRLMQSPAPASRLALELSIPEPALRRLLGAAIALKLLEPRGSGRFGLGPLGAPLLGQPGAMAMILHHHLLYADLADPLALLRGSRKPSAVSRFWAYARADRPAALPPEELAEYSALMAATQSMVGLELVAAYPFGRHRRLLDVGGGEGAFLIEVAKRHAGLELMLFDLPPVALRAEQRFASMSLKATAHGGDFLQDELPFGADVATLVRVLHDHDDAAALAILQRVRRALPAGGCVVIAEPMASALGSARIDGAYFGMYLLAMGSGRARTRGEIEELLTAAGFHRARPLRAASALQTSVLVAQAAAAGPRSRSSADC